MKIRNIVLFATLFIIAFISCDETIEPTIYQGDPTSDRTFLSFPSSIVNLPVTIDATGTVELKLNSSTISANERTFNVSVVDSLTNADPLTYTIPATVTIPANSYSGTLTIVGTDNNLVEPAAKQLTFSLANLPDDVDMDNNTITINIFEVCPIPNGAFTGNYLMQQISPINPCDGVQMFENQIVTISSTGDTSRTFGAIYLEAFSASFPILDINFNLVCNSVIVDVSSSGLACAGATSTINVGPAASPSTYDASDDSVFEVTISEYYTQDGNCGCNPYDTTFRFTKQ